MNIFTPYLKRCDSQLHIFSKHPLIIIIIIILFIIVILIIISFEFDHQYYIAAVIVFCGTFMQAAVYIFLRLDLNHHYHHTLHCQVTIITNVITCIHTGL